MQMTSVFTARISRSTTSSGLDDGLGAVRAIAAEFDSAQPVPLVATPASRDAALQRRTMQSVRAVCWVAALVAVLQVHGAFQAATPAHGSRTVAKAPR